MSEKDLEPEKNNVANVKEAARSSRLSLRKPDEDVSVYVFASFHFLFIIYIVALAF
jgi:hypothetical protein